MKIKFNVEISKKDGLKENHLNCNAEVDITPEELKELFNSKQVSEEPVDVKPEEPVVQNDQVFTVAVCKSTIYKEEIIYAVKNNKSNNYSLISPSIFNKEDLTLRMIKKEEYETLANLAIITYNTNVLDFIHGKKVKEI